MLTLNDIVEFRSRISHKEEIRESDLGRGLTSFCYMIAGDDTFDDAFSREARGIVFDQGTGRVVGRPLHKFFNVNERGETQAHALDWSKVARVMDKRDGSMIHTVIVPHDSRPDEKVVRLKSKKSFDSDVAKAALNWLYLHREHQAFMKRVIELDITAIFEYTAPDARIVLYYPEAELHLLHVRDNLTGRYWTSDELHEIAEQYQFNVVDEPLFGPVSKENLGQYLLDEAKVRENIEGWVVQFENGDMVKLKTDWYLKRHRAMTFLRERDIAEAVLDQNLDDLKSLLVTEGIDIGQIIDIENKVLGEIRGLEVSLREAVPQEDYLMERKDFVMKNREKVGPLFGLLMTKYSGKQPDYVEYFRKNILKQVYTLRQLNLMPSVAETDA